VVEAQTGGVVVPEALAPAPAPSANIPVESIASVGAGGGVDIKADISDKGPVVEEIAVPVPRIVLAPVVDRYVAQDDSSAIFDGAKSGNRTGRISMPVGAGVVVAPSTGAVHLPESLSETLKTVVERMTMADNITAGEDMPVISEKSGAKITEEEVNKFSIIERIIGMTLHNGTRPATPSASNPIITALSDFLYRWMKHENATGGAGGAGAAGGGKPARNISVPVGRPLPAHARAKVHERPQFKDNKRLFHALTPELEAAYKTSMRRQVLFALPSSKHSEKASE